MKDECMEDDYQVGDFIDYNSVFWSAKLIVSKMSMNSIDQYFKIKDPKYNAMASESINCKSTKIKPFRTCSLLKNNQVPTYLSKWKKFDPEGMQKRQQELLDFIQNLQEKTPKQLIQYLRGRHYYFADELINSQLQEKAQYQTLMRFFETHRALIVKYIKTVDFEQADSNDIYASSMSALCSAFPELIQFTTYAVGTASEFDTIKKEYPHWHNQAAFQQVISGWVQTQLFPAILEAKHEYFPPNFIFNLFSLLGSLFSRVIVSKIHQISEIYQTLYDDLKRNLDQYPFYSPKELINFEANCQTYFRHFKIYPQSDSNSESSQTQQIDMNVEPTQQEPPKDKSLEISEREEFSRIKKTEFRLHLLQVYLRKDDYQKFLKEFASLAIDINSKYSQQNYENSSMWPQHIRYFIQAILQRRFLEVLISFNPPNLQQNVQRSIVLKLFPLIPEQILHFLIESEKLILLRHLIQPTSRVVISFPQMVAIIQQIIQKSFDTDNHKEYLDFFNYLQRYLKGLFPQSNVKTLREKLIENLFSMASYLNKQENKALIDNLLDLSDPLRDELWVKFTENEVIPNANMKYSYFYQISINRYFQRFQIDLECFSSICKFMTEPQTREQKYEKRKASVIHALNYKYRISRSEYLDYLSIFLDNFCDPNHDREQHEWISLLPYSNDQKLPSFLTLPMSKEFCEHYLSKLNPLYFETDISIFLKLMLKLNVLNQRVTINKENDSIIKVNDFPDWLPYLLNNLYAPLSMSRIKLIEKEVQKYFFAAEENEEIYNQMLVMFLEVMIRHEAKRSEVNILFKKLKTRYHLIPKLGNIGSITKNEETLICRNRKVYQKCIQLLDKAQNNKFFEPLFEEEQGKIKLELMFNRMDTLKLIRFRLASKLNREPKDIILYLSNQEVEEEKYSLSFQAVYFEQFYSEQKSKEHPYIEYQFSQKAPLIRSQLLNRIPKLYSLLPNTISLLKGVDIVEEDWDQIFSFQMMKTFFITNLQKGEFLEEEFKISHKLDFMLDFFLWKLPNKENYNFIPLLNYLKKIEGTDNIIRNYKIIYLLDQTSHLELSFDDCDHLMMSLLPDPLTSKEKLEKNCQYIRSCKKYELLEELVLKIIESKCKNRLQFMSTCRFYLEFALYQEFYHTYEKLWQKIYLYASMEEKINFFKNFQYTIKNYPDNMRDFYTIITYDELTKNVQFYQQVIAQITSLLLSLNKENLTLTEMKTIEILITNIAQLTDEDKIFHPILQSREMVQFIKANIYHFSERTQRQLLNIIRIVVSNSDNRVILLDFFEKETKQKEWLVKPYLLKTAAKAQQLEGRVGLRNPHSICYVNSFLQQLYHISQFREQLLDTPYAQNHNQQEDLIYQLKKVFLNLHFGRQAYYNFDFFKAFKNIDGGETSIEIQMDVDEFRNLLLDRIQNAIPSTNNFVKRLFNGKQRSIIKSQQCQHSSKKEEEFSSLCIEVKDFNNIEDSLNNYFKPEILNNDNAYHCDECKRKVTAQKFIEIEQLPPYLTFVLKRFEYVSYNRYKINTYFEFPFTDFHYFSGVKYHLKGIIVHMGISQAGHYISYAKHNQVWYEFNDCNVDEVDEQRLRESCFGTNSKGANFCLNQTKNAYVLIYQAEKLPPQKPIVEGAQRNFYGIADEYKKIVRHRILSNKERIYFSQNFLETLNYIAERFTEPSSLHLLFWTVMTIHLRIKNDYVKYEVFMKSFQILKKNIIEFKFLWYENEIERVIEVFSSQMSPQNKSILVQIMVENCDTYNEHAQKILEICLKKIYQDKIDHTGYYIFMYAMAKKFNQACQYLNKQRIVGRILDILFMGIIGQKVRENLKKTCEVQFQSTPLTTKLLKDNTKQIFKYHKWGLLTYILERHIFNLHQIEKQHYLFQITNLTLSAIFSEATQKPIIKFICKFFQILTKSNNQFFSKLIGYIGDQLREKGDFRKYMKVLKQVLFVSGDHIMQRCKLAIIVLNRFLKKLLEDKREYAFLYAWQWFMNIVKTNENFSKMVKQHTAMFQYMTVITPQTLNIYRNKLYEGTYKFQQTKHPLYGIIAPTTVKDAQELIRRLSQQMQSILGEQQSIHDMTDYDGDIINLKLQDGQIILKYDETKVKFTKVSVHFTLGDVVIIRNLDKNSKDGNSTVFSRGDERLRLKSERFPNILLQEGSGERQPSEQLSTHSPKAI